MPILQRKKDNVDLRNYYNLYLQLGLILTLFIMIVMFRANLNLDADIEFIVQEQETIEMEEIVQTEQITKPPPPPRPPVPVEVPNDEIIDDMDLNLDASLDLDMALDLPPPPPAAKQAVVEDEEPEIFLVVEEDPELIGGLEGLQRSIRYPEIARKAGIEGRVFVQFVVDEKGNVIDPVVTRGIGGGCDEAALEAVRKAKFKPGKQRGRPVKVQYSLPVTFRLQN
jgi:periplasmic protein TonB